MSAIELFEKLAEIERQLIEVRNDLETLQRRTDEFDKAAAFLAKAERITRMAKEAWPEF